MGAAGGATTTGTGSTATEGTWDSDAVWMKTIECNNIAMKKTRKAEQEQCTHKKKKQKNKLTKSGDTVDSPLCEDPPFTFGEDTSMFSSFVSDMVKTEHSDHDFRNEDTLPKSRTSQQVRSTLSNIEVKMP